MTFALLPILDTMMDLYQKPRTYERFQEFLFSLQGDNQGDLVLPIMGFNPMAKEHILVKLFELKALEIEPIMDQTLNELNKKLKSEHQDQNYKVAFNLLDDLKGSWTNRFISDYDNKFKIEGLINRNFCTPLFWASEDYSIEKIKIRTLESAYRTLYWQTKRNPITLKEHVEQEKFIGKEVGFNKHIADGEYLQLEEFYEKNQLQDNFNLIFNFFYGNEASKSLAFASFGLNSKATGFDYCYK
jgi:hypothetical protein